MEAVLSRTLLLSRDFEPLKVISWQRAITLLTLGKVEVVSEYDGFVRSSVLVIKIPAVVRLLRVFKRFRRPVKFSRVSVYARDSYTCQYCGTQHNISDLTYDHVVPRAQGGTTTWTNIVTACQDCNWKKGGRTPQQAGMRIIKAPVQPKWIPAVTIPISQTSVPDAWRDYLYWTAKLESD